MKKHGLVWPQFTISTRGLQTEPLDRVICDLKARPDRDRACTVFVREDFSEWASSLHFTQELSNAGAVGSMLFIRHALHRTDLPIASALDFVRTYVPPCHIIGYEIWKAFVARPDIPVEDLVLYGNEANDWRVWIVFLDNPGISPLQALEIADQIGNINTWKTVVDRDDVTFRLVANFIKEKRDSLWNLLFDLHDKLYSHFVTMSATELIDFAQKEGSEFFWEYVCDHNSVLTFLTLTLGPQEALDYVYKVGCKRLISLVQSREDVRQILYPHLYKHLKN